MILLSLCKSIIHFKYAHIHNAANPPSTHRQCTKSISSVCRHNSKSYSLFSLCSEVWKWVLCAHFPPVTCQRRRIFSSSWQVIPSVSGITVLCPSDTCVPPSLLSVNEIPVGSMTAVFQELLPCFMLEAFIVSPIPPNENTEKLAWSHPGLMTNFNKRLLFCYITIKHFMLMP